MIRVLSIIHYPIFGGPHNRNSLVAPFLKRKNVETIVVLPDEPGNSSEWLCKAGVEVVAIPLGRIRAKSNPLYHLVWIKKFWSDVKRIKRLILDRDIDVVQINGLANAQGAIAARLAGVPVVWQILDTFTPMILRYAIMPFVKVLANVVMCTGRQVAEAHPGAIGFGDQLVFFHPPVNLERFVQTSESRKRAREMLNLSQDSLVVGNVGNINLQKGHRTFIRAAALLKKKIPGVQFVILGAMHSNHQEYAKGLWQEAASLGLTIGSDLLVRDPGRLVAELEPAFDFFWMTSEPNSEGIPTAVEEAMALGIPVVATQVGAIEEIVIDGKTGFVVEPHSIREMVEQTVRMYSSDALRLEMSKAAKDFASKNFDIEICAQSHFRAYELALTIQ